MADPLLSSLCRICNISVPKYKCPRCSLQTCSLPCSRRHKTWYACNGLRDPTVFIPKSELVTPFGVDHDYNFLHSIEHKIERKEKLIIEERNLVERAELAQARGVDDGRKRKRESHGDVCIKRELEQMNTKVIKAPKGMGRNMVNGTIWSKKRRSIHWQIEWILEGNTRVLGTAVGKNNLGEIFTEFRELERMSKMTQEEKISERQRRAHDDKLRQTERARLSGWTGRGLIATPVMQNLETGTWSITPSATKDIQDDPLESAIQTNPHPQYHLYLHRPHTPLSFPKVLIPLDQTDTLSDALRNRLILEFPTIYALEQKPDDLPKEFMLERDFWTATGQDLQDTNTNTSTSGSLSEDEDIEEGEVFSDEDIEEGEVV
ncbi:hypothetical protein B7494_g6755 [Chlorociboria aeruginascens]|nr:hypothetical protein B7494_g6755 [Chlorociboria aeruginascens]